MTKRRPSSSERWRQVVALVCGLSLLPVAPAALAAGRKPAARVAAARTKVPVAPRHPAAAKAGPEIVATDVIGVHGHASYYAPHFHGRQTATGERFDAEKFTAATNHFPLGSTLAVRRLDNEMCAIVHINDRMHPKQKRRVIDVSHSVAEYLDMLRAGVVLVQIAPMPAGWRERGASACQEAFGPTPACPDCAEATASGPLPAAKPAPAQGGEGGLRWQGTEAGLSGLGR